MSARTKASGGAAAMTIFALKNAAPDEFSDIQHHHIDGNLTVERVERRIIDVTPERAEPPLIEGEALAQIEPPVEDEPP